MKNRQYQRLEYCSALNWLLVMLRAAHCSGVRVSVCFSFRFLRFRSCACVLRSRTNGEARRSACRLPTASGILLSSPSSRQTFATGFFRIFLRPTCFFTATSNDFLSPAFLAAFRGPFLIIFLIWGTVQRNFLASKTRLIRLSLQRRCQFRTPAANMVIRSAPTIRIRVISILSIRAPEKHQTKRA